MATALATEPLPLGIGTTDNGLLEGFVDKEDLDYAVRVFRLQTRRRKPSIGGEDPGPLSLDQAAKPVEFGSRQ